MTLTGLRKLLQTLQDILAQIKLLGSGFRFAALVLHRC
jgi:hypothetical protein